ncbi:hypothetical protein ACFX2I_037662 [Malus domestica]
MKNPKSSKTGTIGMQNQKKKKRAQTCCACSATPGTARATTSSTHCFDFQAVRKALGLNFYGSFKLINFVHSQVAENRCRSCGLTCQSNQDLQNHLHETVNFKDITPGWDSDEYIKPF